MLITCSFAPGSVLLPSPKFLNITKNCLTWAPYFPGRFGQLEMLGEDRRVGRWGEARMFLPPSLCLRQHFSLWPDLFQDFSFHQTSFLSLVPVSLVAIALVSAIVLALIGWPCCLDSENFISSFHPSSSVGDSGFLLLLISGWSCHFHVSCLSRFSPVQLIPSVKFPIWNT